MTQRAPTYFDDSIDDYRCPFDGAEIVTTFDEDDGTPHRECEWGHPVDEEGQVSE